MPRNTSDYDLEPVQYCAKCYSLRIGHEDTIDTDYCMDCGSTETASTGIKEWEQLYKSRHSHDYVDRNDDPKGSVYFKMSLDELKSRLYNSSVLDTIIYKLYGSRFPQVTDRAEAVMVLFDKLGMDNRLDDLRYMMYDYNVISGSKIQHES